MVWGAVTVLLVVAAVLGGWALRGSDDDGTGSADDSIEVGVPTIVSSSELEKVVGSHDPVYWAGERPDTKLELTMTRKGAVFIRYLPEDAEAGDDQTYLTVGTYSDIDGYDALSAAAPEVARVQHAQNGAVIAVFKKQPKSTYFSFEDANFQVEVFSPEKGESQELTDDGSITLVGGTP
jgi:hypothetical protein